MVRVDQDGMTALIAGEVLRGFEELAAHSPSLKFRQDVEGEFGQVEVVRERQRDVDGSGDFPADPGHEDDLALVRVRHFQQLFLRRVGEIVAPPGLHSHLASHFDGGNEVGGVCPVKGIRDPQLFNPYVVCHNGHHPQLFCHPWVPETRRQPGYHRQHMPVCAGVPSNRSFNTRPSIPAIPVPSAACGGPFVAAQPPAPTLRCHSPSQPAARKPRAILIASM